MDDCQEKWNVLHLPWGKHSSRQCKLKSQCDSCDAFHHALLHRDRQQKASGSASQSGMRHGGAAMNKPKANEPTAGLFDTRERKLT